MTDIRVDVYAACKVEQSAGRIDAEQRIYGNEASGHRESYGAADGSGRNVRREVARRSVPQHIRIISAY